MEIMQKKETFSHHWILSPVQREERKLRCQFCCEPKVRDDFASCLLFSFVVLVAVLLFFFCFVFAFVSFLLLFVRALWLQFLFCFCFFFFSCGDCIPCQFGVACS